MADKNSYSYLKNRGCIVMSTIISVIMAAIYAELFDVWNWFPWMMAAIAITFVVLLILSHKKKKKDS